jgi:hypothetical protein
MGTGHQDIFQTMYLLLPIRSVCEWLVKNIWTGYAERIIWRAHLQVIKRHWEGTHKFNRHTSGFPQASYYCLTRFIGTSVSRRRRYWNGRATGPGSPPFFPQHLQPSFPKQESTIIVAYVLKSDGFGIKRNKYRKLLALSSVSQQKLLIGEGKLVKQCTWSIVN